MSTQQASNIFTTPVGRLVWEQLNEPRVKDFDGKPLVIKSGPDKDKPTQRYECGVAFPKGNEGHWANTEWGKVIWAIGHAAHPQSAQREDFAWKVVDGDSTKLNKRNRRWCDIEGYKGCWVVTFSSSFAPKFYNRDGTAPITEKNAVKAGYYVQVRAQAAGNDGATPGVYINHVMIALSGYGPEIVTGPDPASAGFGQAALPAGASLTPVGGMQQPPPPAAPGGNPPPPASSSPPPPAAPPPAQTAVQPNNGFLNPPAAPGAPPPPAASPPPPAAPTAPQMTAKATATYQAYRTSGWTDEQLRAHGLMV